MMSYSLQQRNGHMKNCCWVANISLSGAWRTMTYTQLKRDPSLSSFIEQKVWRHAFSQWTPSLDMSLSLHKMFLIMRFILSVDIICFSANCLEYQTRHGMYKPSINASTSCFIWKTEVLRALALRKSISVQ